MPDYLVAIPTFWTHPGGRGEEAVIFDHPTPLQSPGTLRRTLESLAPLVRPGLRVAVVAAAAHPSLAEAAAAQVQDVVSSPPLPYPVLRFGAPHLEALKIFLAAQGRSRDLDLLSLDGYSPVRNITLILAALCQAEALVSLDDDEIVDDPGFFSRIDEDLAALGRRHPVFGLAGIYRHADGSVLLPEPQDPWAAFWPKFAWMNQAFRHLILTGPRLKPTPLALGGNLIVPAPLLRRLPFDPAVSRGEDLDYVLNARFFGIPFFLDNTLAIVHLPPAKPHPAWQRLRQDLVRFAYTRLKLAHQAPGPGLTQVLADDLAPYPGNFLKEDLDLRAYRCHTALARHYLAAGDAAAAAHALDNLALLEQVNATGHNVFSAYLAFQARWQALLAWLVDPPVAARARQAMWGMP